MASFEPSRNFISRTMDGIRKYELERSVESATVTVLVFSKPAFAAISAGGILLGVFNVIRMTLILLSPSLCL